MGNLDSAAQTQNKTSFPLITGPPRLRNQNQKLRLLPTATDTLPPRRQVQHSVHTPAQMEARQEED
jgi:hypothetical protein